MQEAIHCTHGQEVAETAANHCQVRRSALIAPSGSEESFPQPAPRLPQAPTGACHAAKGHPTDAGKPGQWPSDLSLNHRVTSSFFFYSPSLSVSHPPWLLVFKQIRTE